MSRKFAGADWIKSALKVEKMSPLGETVANLLGDLYGGIYHLEDDDLKKVEWDNARYIVFVLRHKRLATVDTSQLTQLVFLCHDNCIRCEISARSPGRLELMFHQREREGHIWERHPTIEQALGVYRKYHPIEEAERAV